MVPQISPASLALTLRPCPDEDSIAVFVALPEEYCERIRRWVRETRDERCSRWYAMNMYVEDEFDTSSIFWLNGKPCHVGTFATGSYKTGPILTGLEVWVTAEGNGLDYTQPRSELGLDGRLEAAATIRKLLEIGSGGVSAGQR